MSETVFKGKAEPTSTSKDTAVGKDPSRGEEGTAVEVPYLDYEQEHNHPHSVDYFNVGDTWEDPYGGFPEEISLIEEYLQKQIEKGEIANSVSAVKTELKRIEKINNLTSEERPVVKVGVLSAYTKFLMETSKIKFNSGRYGRHGNN